MADLVNVVKVTNIVFAVNEVKMTDMVIEGRNGENHGLVVVFILVKRTNLVVVVNDVRVTDLVVVSNGMRLKWRIWWLWSMW